MKNDPVFSLDERNRAILKHLLGQPEATAEQISSGTGIASDTVYKRLKRMRDVGVIDCRSSVAEHLFPMKYVGIIRVNKDIQGWKSTSDYPYTTLKDFVKFLASEFLQQEKNRVHSQHVYIRDVYVVAGIPNTDVLTTIGTLDRLYALQFCHAIKFLRGVEHFALGDAFRWQDIPSAEA